MLRSDEVLDYWFGPSDDPAEAFARQRPMWFNGGAQVDEAIRREFMEDIRAALDGELDDWLDAPRSCLALVILLDQFTRNVFRGTPRAFAGDVDALAAAEHAIQHGYEAQLAEHERLFLYVPFEHSESLAVQDRGVAHFERLAAEATAIPKDVRIFLDYAVQHRDIIARFGRFPHRNAILGRETTAEEAAFLEQPGSSF